MLAMLLAAGAITCRGSRDTARRPPANTNAAPPAGEPAATPASSTIVTPEEAKLLEHYTKFDHNRAEHKKQDCGLCHQRANNDAAPVLPFHTACMDCHGKDYTSTSSQ